MACPAAEPSRSGILEPREKAEAEAAETCRSTASTRRWGATSERSRQLMSSTRRPRHAPLLRACGRAPSTWCGESSFRSAADRGAGNFGIADHAGHGVACAVGGLEVEGPLRPEAQGDFGDVGDVPDALEGFGAVPFGEAAGVGVTPRLNGNGGAWLALRLVGRASISTLQPGRASDGATIAGRVTRDC